jgi:hypothetical protein
LDQALVEVPSKEETLLGTPPSYVIVVMHTRSVFTLVPKDDMILRSCQIFTVFDTLTALVVL